MLILCCVIIAVGVVIYQSAASRGKSRHTQQPQRQLGGSSQAWQTSSTAAADGLKLSATNPIAGDMPPTSAISVDDKKPAFPFSSSVSITPTHGHQPPERFSLEKMTAFQSTEMAAPALTTPPPLEQSSTVGDPSQCPASDSAADPLPSATPLHSDNTTLATSTNAPASQASSFGAPPAPPNYDHVHLYHTVLQS